MIDLIRVLSKLELEPPVSANTGRKEQKEACAQSLFLRRPPLDVIVDPQTFPDIGPGFYAREKGDRKNEAE